MSEEISEACGVFGVVSTSTNVNIFPFLYWGLLSLNHRGQQSYGFVTLAGKGFRKKEDLNLIPTDEESVEKLEKFLKGRAGIANARYATSGGTGIRHLKGGKQPMVVSSSEAKIAVSYNGNIVNTKSLKRDLRERFGRFKSNADTEVLAKEILLGLEDFHDYDKAIAQVLQKVEGAYSAMVLDSDGSLHAFRDPHGIRPYCFGRKDGLFAFASESPALDINSFETLEFVRGGEHITVSANGNFSRKVLEKEKSAMCSFEFAYFARPDSILNRTDIPVYKVRELFAKNLAHDYKSRLSKDDVILSIPETADDAAYAMHESTGLPWERAVRKNRYVTRRAFISIEEQRQDVIDKKMNVISSLVNGKKIAVVEDSVVRGDTSKINVAKLRRKGAKRVDLYVTFPKITNPCLYGVDMATYGELIGSGRSEIEIAKWLGADSVSYQKIEGLVNAIGLPRSDLCLGCVTGKYPTKIAQRLADRSKRRFDSSHPEGKRRIYES